MLVTSPKWMPEMKARALRNVEFVRANMPAIIAMGVPTPKTFGDRLRAAVKKKKANNPDDLERLKKKAEEQGQNVNWEQQERFKRKPHAGIVATGLQAEETFGEKLKREIGRRAAQRRDSAQQAKERARYRKPQRRQHCKGE